MYLLYKTDAIHTHASRELMGVFDSKPLMLNAVVEYLDENKEENLSDEDIILFLQIAQTQNRLDNFLYIEVDVNVCLK